MVLDRIRTYSELMQLQTFEERFNYLKLDGVLGQETFGVLSSRWMNQHFYKSREWQLIKREIIIRDSACDMALPGFTIPNTVKMVVHHMNPITEEDIINHTSFLTNPEFLVCVSFETHCAIHYGDINVARIAKEPAVRQANDQCPWLSDFQANPLVSRRQAT